MTFSFEAMLVTMNRGDMLLVICVNSHCLLVLGDMLMTGKTTILKILGGKHMVEPHMVRVLGRSAFHDTALTSSGDLCYLGGEVNSLVS